MVVETWIEMLKEKLKHILSLLRLGASIDAFLEAWTSSVHPLEG
jgi:vacuolar-type H+-ATPase subunit E/Vma4